MDGEVGDSEGEAGDEASVCEGKSGNETGRTRGGKSERRAVIEQGRIATEQGAEKKCLIMRSDC